MLKVNSYPTPKTEYLNYLPHKNKIQSRQPIHRSYSNPVDTTTFPKTIAKKTSNLRQQQHRKFCEVIQYSIFRILKKRKPNSQKDLSTLSLNLQSIFLNHYNIRFDREILGLSLLYFYRLIYTKNNEIDLFANFDLNKLFLICLSLSLKFLRDEKVENKFFLIYKIINNIEEMRFLELIVLNQLHFTLHCKRSEWLNWCNILNALELECEEFNIFNV